MIPATQRVLWRDRFKPPGIPLIETASMRRAHRAYLLAIDQTVYRFGMDGGFDLHLVRRTEPFAVVTEIWRHDELLCTVQLKGTIE